MTGVIVHEWLESMGGAEKVVMRLADIYPDAPIVALWNDAPGRFQEGRVHESWLAHTPFRRHKAAALPIMPLTWRTLGARSADWVLCSSHLFAHHARFSGRARDARKFVYAYTPARYIWEPGIDERGSSHLVRAAAGALRPIDRRRAAEAHSVAAISEFVRERIERSWDRDSAVIYPPVAVEAFSGEPDLSDEERDLLARLPADFLLGASRFVTYKKLDTVIRTGAIAKVPVVIAGSGPDLARLQSVARDLGTEVHFVHQPSHDLLHALYARSIAFVFPAVEDFGIMPVEAMAAGTAVLGPRIGGVSETVSDGVSGALIESFESVEDVKEGISRIRTLKRSEIVARADLFNEARFDCAIRGWIDGESR